VVVESITTEIWGHERTTRATFLMITDHFQALRGTMRALEMRNVHRE
jgi:hypothetical protein